MEGLKKEHWYPHEDILPAPWKNHSFKKNSYGYKFAMNLKSILELPNVYKRPEVGHNFSLLSFRKEKKRKLS